MTSTVPERYPDLTGKAVVVVGVGQVLIEITHHLAANSMLIAVVAPDRELVHGCVESAEGLGAMVNGFTVDPGDPAVWQRVAPHIEQRLGPIDVVICEGSAELRDVVRGALLPDMVARRRGVVIEITAPEDPGPVAAGVRRHVVDAGMSRDVIAATALRYASDTAG